MKVSSLINILREQDPNAEVEIIRRHNHGESFVDIAEIQLGTFTRITDVDAAGQPYESPLVERSPLKCRIILES